MSYAKIKKEWNTRAPDLLVENHRLREENEILREAFDADKNEEELKEMAKLMNQVGALREVVRMQTEALQNNMKTTNGGIFLCVENTLSAIKAGENILK